MKSKVAAIFAGAWLVANAGPVVAQDVTLTSRDKSIEISGNLLGYDGDYYRVDTVYGELTIDSTGVLCEGPACPSLENYIAHLTFSGSRLIGQVLLPALIEGFARNANMVAVREELESDALRYWLQSANGSTTTALFDIRLTSSGEGFADVLSNEADIAMSLREATADEVALTQGVGLGQLTTNRQQVFLGFDAVSIIVPEASPMDAISLDEVAGILAGDVTRWTDLGVTDDAPVQPVAFEGMSELWGRVHADLTAFGHTQSEETRDIPSSDQTDNVLAVSFGLHSQIPERMHALPFKSECEMVHEPTELALRSRELPFRFPLILYRPMRRLPEIGQEFLDFVRSFAGQRVVARAEYVPATPSVYEFDAIGYRIVNAMLLSETQAQFDDLKTVVASLKSGSMIGGGLWVDETGSLTAGSISLIDHVAQMVEIGAIDGQTILFAGFGPDDALAEMAAGVFSEAIGSGSYNVETKSLHFGDVMPIACPGTRAGDALNARVEIWLK